jgi:hypothetical protein
MQTELVAELQSPADALAPGRNAGTPGPVNTNWIVSVEPEKASS